MLEQNQIQNAVTQTSWDQSVQTQMHFDEGIPMSWSQNGPTDNAREPLVPFNTPLSGNLISFM
jgi:hypothetical protein